MITNPAIIFPITVLEPNETIKPTKTDIPKKYSHDGTVLMDFNLPNECVIVSITRDDTLIIPRGNTPILSGDKLIIICRNEYLHQLLHALHIE